jgi:hypothetical protein
MNEIMEFMEELKELCHKGEQIAQQMQGSNFGQRHYRYGMRDNQMNSPMGGSYGQRWGSQPMQGQYPMQGMQMQGGYPNQQWPDVNPMMFM